MSDVNGDGNLDVIAITLQIHAEDGTVPSPLYFDIGSTHIQTIASGDFDGDGWSDSVASGNNTLIVLLNDGDW